MSGLEANDRIVVGGLHEVIPGVPVKIVNEIKAVKKKDNIFIKIFRKIKNLTKRVING